MANRTHRQIDILWEETLALEGRAAFYDRVGALKDVVQNRVLQILSLVAVDPPPAVVDGVRLQDPKVNVLRSLRPPTRENVASRTRRAPARDASRRPARTYPATPMRTASMSAGPRRPSSRSPSTSTMSGPWDHLPLPKQTYQSIQVRH